MKFRGNRSVESNFRVVAGGEGSTLTQPISQVPFIRKASELRIIFIGMKWEKV